MTHANTTAMLAGLRELPGAARSFVSQHLVEVTMKTRILMLLVSIALGAVTMQASAEEETTPPTTSDDTAVAATPADDSSTEPAAAVEPATSQTESK